jgi:CelD/BcsL family acetyltransferase involved in cellulose biosynthesis
MRNDVLEPKNDLVRRTQSIVEPYVLNVGALRVVDIDPVQDPRWERFVANHPDGLIYHHPAWLTVLQKEFGQRLACLACEDEAGNLHGILPLSWTRGLPLVPNVRTGRRLSSLPRTPVAGPLSLHDRCTATLIDAAIDAVGRAPGARLELKPNWNAPAPSSNRLIPAPWRKAFVLELPSRIEDLSFGTSRNRARINWAVRKADRLGVRVRSAQTWQDVREWYRLYLETMRSHLLPPRPLRLFNAMWDELRPNGLMWLLLAERDNELIAGSLYLMFGSTVFYAFNGCRRSELSLRPNDVIQWHAIRDSCRQGFQYYDLGEVAHDNHGLADFKAKWGAAQVQLYRYYYPRRVSDKSDGQNPHVEPAVPGLLEAAWRRLPLKATAAVGNRIYRFL